MKTFPLMNSPSAILEITTACYNKVDSEENPFKYKSPTLTLITILEKYGFETFYQFTEFLETKYNKGLALDDIFVDQAYSQGGKARVVRPEKREILLSYYKSIMRDIKLSQVL